MNRMKRIFTLVLSLGFVSAGFGQADTLTKIAWYKAGQGIPSDAQWINNSRRFDPILHTDKIYLLNFYSPSSPGCSDIIETFNKVAKKYTTTQLIHVLVPQHEAEKDSVNIREYLARNNMHHPVLLTDSLEVFEKSLKPLTPTSGAVLIERGRRAKIYRVPPDYETLESDLDSLLTKLAIPLELNRVGKTLESEVKRVPTPVLGYPVAIAALEREARFYVTDIRKHQIVAIESDGQVNEIIGSGIKGYRDGRFSQSQFNSPQGIAIDKRNRIIYISDTENHVIRRADLNTGEVSTILGNGFMGQQSTGQVVGSTGPISSPMGLALGAGKLYIAMAGYNQVWEMDLATGKAVVLAGSGKSRSEDGAGNKASFLQPTSLSFDGDGTLYVLESLSGNIRTMNVKGEVTTVFNNEEAKIKLQNPGDILVTEEGIFVTDTYNNQLKQLVKDECIAITGLPVAGWTDGKPGKAMFNEPKGMAMMNGSLMIADFANSLIRSFSPRKSKLSTFKLSKYGPLDRYEEAITMGTKANLGPVKIGNGTNKITLFIDAGEDFNLVLNGRNECDISDTRGHNKLVNDRTAAGEIVFESQGTPENQYILAEVYLTFKDRVKEEAVYYMPITLLIEFEYVPGNSSSQSVTFNLADFVDAKYP